MERDAESTADPAEVRAAIDHLGDRERACLHRIHEELDEVDLRDEATEPAPLS